MFPKKSAKPPKKTFTNEQIRARAYQIWEKNKEQSEEENWNAAIKALERERRFRVLIGIWRWTGLGEKKGWDIVTSLSIPLIVFGGGILFNYLNGKQQQEIADQKQKDELLKTYLDDMKGFLLDKDHPLKKSKWGDESSSIARAITLTTLTQLNSSQDEQRSKDGKYNQRKGLIMQFLYESGLSVYISNTSSIIPLDEADFSFANLSSSFLVHTFLYRANLESADLSRAILSHTILDRADLENANLDRADLENANLESANLESANLESANLKNANLESAKNLTNSQIKASCYWEKAIYTEAEWKGDNKKRGWFAKDEAANQKKIDEIKQDKVSDPATPPDCSMWK